MELFFPGQAIPTAILNWILGNDEDDYVSAATVISPIVKDAIVEHYKGNDHPDIVSSVKYCTDVNYDLDKLNMFYSQVRFSDEFRGESFAETFPEFYELLKKYGNPPEDF